VKDSYTAKDVAQWLAERLANCQRLAQEKTGADRAGWLEDARYFKAALHLLADGQSGPRGEWKKAEPGACECKSVHLLKAEAIKGGEICAFALHDGEFYEYRVNVPPFATGESQL
jgi:hypothetical protein